MIDQIVKEWEELNAKATPHSLEDAKLHGFLRNHSEALLELVKAAENLQKFKEINPKDFHRMPTYIQQIHTRVLKALAKLEGK